MKYSIITTCKGRLEFLRQSLPSFLAQQDAEVIVVDYDCPEKTADHVAAEFPAAKTVRVTGEPKFSATKARNIGVAAATGEVFIFVDADICLVPDFTARLSLTEKQFGIFTFCDDARGSFVVPRAMFLDVEGYDEVIFGYSQEDLELYARLGLAGYETVILDKELIAQVLPHSNEKRIAFTDMGRKLAYVRGKIYRDAKNYLLLMSRRKEITYDARLALWEKINEMLSNKELFDGPHSLDIPLPVADAKAYLPNCEFSGALRLTIHLRK